MSKVVVIGQTCLDIFIVDHGAKKLFGKGIWPRDIIMRLGGSGIYSASALTALNINVTLLSVVGNEDDIRQRLTRISSEKFSIDSIIYNKNELTPKSVCKLDDGRKTFISCSELLDFDSFPDIFSSNPPTTLYIAGYWLFPSFWTPEFHSILRQAKNREIPVVVDTQQWAIDTPEYNSLILDRDLAKVTDVLLVANKEALRITSTNSTEKALSRLKEANFKSIIIKLGKEGCLVSHNDEISHFPDYSPYKVKNTVGAGDTFGAAFCYAIEKGHGVRKRQK